MIAVAVEFLTGVACLDQRVYDTPGSVEWPPHPDRLFMALVAAAHRCGPNPGELDALRWLEAAGPPEITASATIDRPTVESYRPTNDKLRRQRNKAKLVPSTCPDDPRVWFTWASEPPHDVRSRLAEIATRMTYLGSSESLVSCWVDGEPPMPTWRPEDGKPTTFLRTPHQGRLAALQADFEAGVRPGMGGWTPYTPASTAVAIRGEWRDLIALELSHPVDSRDVSRLIEATRRCVLEACPDPIPSWVSGHTPGGDRLRGPHLALTPMANVGHAHADGRVLGVGLLIPNQVDPDKVRQAMAAWSDGKPRWVDQHTSITLANARTMTTTPSHWMRSSRRWGTVTPIMLHRWPDRETADELLLTAFDHAELPPPHRIEILKASPHRGGLGSDIRDAPPRYRIHAVIEWDREVTGPVAIGAGRYKGWGWCQSL